MQTSPPYVPIRSSAWPQRRMPKWLYFAFAGIVAAGIAVALVHKPSAAQRESDFRGFLHDVTTDVESCAGGVGESLAALRQIQPGASASSADVQDAILIAQSGAANCSPANNELIDDLENYQVTESLASLRLGSVVAGLVRWTAADAGPVQSDVALVLSARTSQARSQAEADLTKALAALDKQRAAINSVLAAANRSLGVRYAGPVLPR